MDKIDPWPEGLYECLYGNGEHWSWYYYEEGSVYLCDRDGNKIEKEHWKTPLKRQECAGRMVLRERKHPPTPEEIQQQLKEDREKIMKASCKVTMLLILFGLITLIITSVFVALGIFINWGAVSDKYFTFSRGIGSVVGLILTVVIAINCWKQIPCLQFNFSVSKKQS